MTCTLLIHYQRSFPKWEGVTDLLDSGLPIHTIAAGLVRLSMRLRA